MDGNQNLYNNHEVIKEIIVSMFKSIDIEATFHMLNTL